MTSWAISSHPSSNKSPPSSPYHVGSFKKSVPEEKYDEKLPAGIGADSSSYPLAVDGDFNMGDMSGGNYILNNHTFFNIFVVPITVVWVLDMVLKTSTISTNVKTQVL